MATGATLFLGGCFSSSPPPGSVDSAKNKNAKSIIWAPFGSRPTLVASSDARVGVEIANHIASICFHKNSIPYPRKSQGNHVWQSSSCHFDHQRRSGRTRAAISNAFGFEGSNSSAHHPAQVYVLLVFTCKNCRFSEVLDKTTRGPCTLYEIVLCKTRSFYNRQQKNHKVDVVTKQNFNKLRMWE